MRAARSNDRQARGLRVRELGAMSPIMAMVCLALAGVAMGGATLGRVVAVRADAQRAADAAALSAATIIKQKGLPFDATSRAAAEQAGSKNSSQAINYTWSIAETTTAIDFTVTTSINMSAPTFIYPAGSVGITAKAKGRVPQTKFDTATRRLPKLVIVMDFSGSMGAIMPGSGGQEGIQVLKDSVRNLLDAGLQIDYGAVLFSTNTFASVGIGPGAPAQIKNLLNTFGAGGSTCTSCGLSTALNLLSAAGDDTGRYVLLVSDGQPNFGGAEAGARASANTLWGFNATLFTLHVDWSAGHDPSLTAFMQSVSGTPASHPNATFYYRADNATTLRDTFKSIISEIVCSVGPLTPAPTDPATMKVFLRDSGGVERSVPQVPDLGAVTGTEAFRFDVPSSTVRLSQTACDAVLDNHNTIVIRDTPIGLAE